MSDDSRARSHLENSKALMSEISAALTELQNITDDMAKYWAGYRVDKSMSVQPLDAGYRAMQDRETVLRYKFRRLAESLQAAHRDIDPAGTHGRSIVDYAERIAKERLP